VEETRSAIKEDSHHKRLSSASIYKQVVVAIVKTTMTSKIGKQFAKLMLMELTLGKTMVV